MTPARINIPIRLKVCSSVRIRTLGDEILKPLARSWLAHGLPTGCPSIFEISPTPNRSVALGHRVVMESASSKSREPPAAAAAVVTRKKQRVSSPPFPLEQAKRPEYHPQLLWKVTLRVRKDRDYAEVSFRTVRDANVSEARASAFRRRLNLTSS